MERKYDLNDLSMMTGFTTRTLRNHMEKGLLHGEKEDGVWRFSEDEIDAFFHEPYVKEGLRIKYHSVVFDHLAQSDKDKESGCVILDIPCDVIKGNKISAFFCEQMKEAKDLRFNFRYDKGMARVILQGDAQCMMTILEAWKTAKRELC